MLESIGEIILETFAGLFTLRIKNHPYYTCLYRAFLITTPLYIWLTVKHYHFDKNWAEMALYDAGVSLGVWTVVSIFLMSYYFFIGDKRRV